MRDKKEDPHPTLSRKRERAQEALTPTALILAGLASTLLGWRPGEFWGVTPADLATALGPYAPDATPPDAQTIARLIQENPDG